MHLIIALILQATTPDAAAAPAQSAPTETTQPAAAPLPLEPEMVCRWETPAGQRIRRRVCREVSEIDAQAQISADATRHMQEIRGGSYITEEMARGGMRP